jgi:hypothetical protein
MKWYFISNLSKSHSTKVEVPFAGIHKDDWRHGYYILEYIDATSNNSCEEHFTSYDSFINWKIAAERRAAWSIGG